MEIQFYQELTTYAGTTIVENDAECYMEVLCRWWRQP